VEHNTWILKNINGNLTRGNRTTVIFFKIVVFQIIKRRIEIKSMTTGKQTKVLQQAKMMLPEIPYRPRSKRTGGT